MSKAIRHVQGRTKPWCYRLELYAKALKLRREEERVSDGNSGLYIRFLSHILLIGAESERTRWLQTRCPRNSGVTRLEIVMSAAVYRFPCWTRSMHSSPRIHATQMLLLKIFRPKSILSRWKDGFAALWHPVHLLAPLGRPWGPNSA
jgi:hypothetical protein